VTDDEVREQIAAIPDWYHRIEVRPGIVTPGIQDSQLALQLLQLPDDCRGLRVLDIGARDGFFSFEMERRGAEVLAVDYVPATETGFALAASILGSHVEYRHSNLYDLSPDTLGTFDIVLFLGVLYHLPDPLLGLRIVRSLCRDRLYLETYIIDRSFRLSDGTFTALDEIDPRLSSIPLMQFFPGSALGGDPTNFWGPNIQCVTDMLAQTNITIVRTERLIRRAVFECRVPPEPLAPYELPGHARREQRAQ